MSINERDTRSNKYFIITLIIGVVITLIMMVALFMAGSVTVAQFILLTMCGVALSFVLAWGVKGLTW